MLSPEDREDDSEYAEGKVARVVTVQRRTSPRDGSRLEFAHPSHADLLSSAWRAVEPVHRLTRVTG